MLPTQNTETPTAGLLYHLGETVLCEDCEEVLSDFFCNVCQCSLCAECWDRQPAHRRKRVGPGQAPHEKTELQLANRLNTVFAYPGDDRAMERLHREDEISAWFGLEREIEDGRPFMFRDHGRFADLATSSHLSLFKQRRPAFKGSNDDTNCIPSLVSFVGQTGAGKSTLIKLMIQFNQWSGQIANFPTPVPGIAGRDLPTSEDVHLYADPLTAGSEFPILYADSEGLDGGEREPLAATLRKTRGKKESESLGSESDYLPTRNYTVREVKWMTEKASRTRKFAAGQLYPRILFGFSDVVVFVHRNPRAIEGVLERLLEWGSVAIETTYNQPILPYAVLALNATENDADSYLWDVQNSTRSLLDSLANTVNKNVIFSNYAELWRKRGKTIDTLEDLMMCYYSALRVVRLPTNGRPKLIEAQAQKLYLDIERGCRLARNLKAQTRMLLNAFEFQAYLNHAFDHFCTTIDTPFDFVQCSYLNRRLSSTFGESILSLAIDMAKRKPRPKASTIMEKLGRLIASCIMLDAVRNDIKGTAERIIAQYVPQIEAALREFGDHHWPCEFYVKGPVPPHLQAYMDNMSFQQSVRAAAVIMRCANVRSGHAAKGHQLTDGRVFARGSYESSFSFERDRTGVLGDIKSCFHHFMDALAVLSREGYSLLEGASVIHRDDALSKHYAATEDNESLTSLRYTSFCICCLFGTPEALLPCGHMLCRSCVQAYGRTKRTHLVELHECPIDLKQNIDYQPRLFYIRPEAAGLRVLALSNGGIRSIVQVEILRLMEKALEDKLPISSLFDMIIGEGSGGMLALGIVSGGWTVDNCEQNLQSLLAKIFTQANLQRFPNMSLRPSRTTAVKYRSRVLDEALSSLFPTEQRIIDNPLINGPMGQSTRVAVLTSSATGRKVLLSNYRRRPNSDLPYTLYPIGDYTTEPKVWEVARAAMAHTELFKAYTDPRLGRLFFQKDMSENFLIEVAQRESTDVHMTAQKDFPDVLLSLGCGRVKRGPAPSTMSSDSRRTKGSRWTRPTVDDATSIFSDISWEQQEQYPRPNFISLSPILDELPQLDDMSAMPELQRLIQDATDPAIISKLVAQLFATLFYAEIDEPVEEENSNEALLPVRVYCRLLDGTSDIEGAGVLMKHGPFRNSEFVFWESGQHPQQFPLSSTTVDEMIRNKKFLELKILIPLCIPDAIVHGVLRLENGEEFPLSNFPRCVDPTAQGHSAFSQTGQRLPPPSASPSRSYSVDAATHPTLGAWLDTSGPSGELDSELSTLRLSTELPPYEPL